MSKKPSRFHVDESDLWCKNQCGFYGNTAWKGYCSVCYKSLTNRQQSSSHRVHQHASVEKAVSQRQATPELSYSKFADKRRQQSKTNPVKSLFKSTKKDKSEVDKTSSKGILVL